MERRKFVVGLGALAAGGAAATGTGAFSAARIEDRDVDIGVVGDASALIQLEPGHDVVSDSTVSDNRVFIDDEEQLAISFNDDGGGDGINPNSTYQVGAIGPGLISSVEGQAETSPQVDDFEDAVLYGPVDNANERVDDEATATWDDPAFVMRNETDQDYRFQMRYEEENPPEGVDVIVAGVRSEDGDGSPESFLFSATSGGPSRTQDVIFDSGGEYRFSILAIADGDAEGAEFDESLSIELTERSL